MLYLSWRSRFLLLLPNQEKKMFVGIAASRKNTKKSSKITKNRKGTRQTVAFAVTFFLTMTEKNIFQDFFLGRRVGRGMKKCDAIFILFARQRLEVYDGEVGRLPG
jgi:hypothetical protein